MPGRKVALPICCCSPCLFQLFIVFALLLTLQPLVSSVLLNPADKPGFEQLLSEWPAFRDPNDPDIDNACSTWAGILCDNSGYILELSCLKRPMRAPLPRALGNFTRLTAIYCLESYIVGPIPPEIFTPTIQVISVGNNYLNGTVPPQLANAALLSYMNLFDNQLTGIFPDIPDKLPVMHSLVINYNRFVCPFPIGIYRMLNQRDGSWCANSSSLGGNFWDSQGDGEICGEALPEKGNGRCIVSTFPSSNTTDRDPDFTFASPTVHVELHGYTFFIFSKLRSGAVNRGEYYITRAISSNIYETEDAPLVEAIPIPKFTSMKNISETSYELSTDLLGVNASRVFVYFDLSEPHGVYYSINVTGLKPRATSTGKRFYSIYLQHEIRVGVIPDDGFMNCSTIGVSINCSTPTLFAGGGAAVFFAMYAQSPTLAMDFRAELNIRAQGGVFVPIFVSRGPLYISGVGLPDKLGLSPLTVPKERQGVGLDCEMILQVTGEPNYMSWSDIHFSFQNRADSSSEPGAVAISNNDALAALMLIPIAVLGTLVGIFVWRRIRKDANAKRHLTLLATVSSEMSEVTPMLGLRRIDPVDLVTMQTLGTGSFGSVQLATFKGEFVAVKKLNNSGSQEHLEALMREAEVMASLAQCKNIVKLLGVCTGNSAIVMEFCPRGSLSNYLKRRLVLSEYEMFKVAFGIMTGMVTLETAKVVHRDLAARNVLLDEHLFAKVSDFGYSHKSSGHSSSAANDKDSLGPVKWQAPEALQALASGGSANTAVELTTASDVWSFGCTLIEIMTGQEPYYGYRSSIIQLATQVANGALNPLSHLQDTARNISIPAWILPTVRSCFAFKPEDRPTFRELRYQMVKAARELHNQYENEVDEVDSLLNAGGYYARVVPSPGAASVKSDPAPSGGSQVFASESTILSNKVDISHVERLNKLGEGSFGTVYLGISQGTYVALKLLSVTTSSDDVRREAAVMTAIKPHRNIVQLYGLVSTGEQLQIVMEFAPKGSLEGFLKSAQAGTTRVTEGLQFKWAVGIARGMQALAASNVIHRDLASRNILLDSALEPKISDFGMSRTVLDPNRESSTRSEIGPIRWFAPECFDLKYSEKSDVWAFGCTLIEIITGEVPFLHLKLLEVPSAVLSGRTPIEGLHEISSLIPDWLMKSLEMCFKFSTTDRASFVELVTFLESQGSSIQEVREAEEEIQKRRQRRTMHLRNKTAIKNDSENM